MRFLHQVCRRVGKAPAQGRCTECGRQGRFRLVPREPIVVSSTNPKTAKRSKLATCQPVIDHRVHVFSDGSSSGACAAVVVKPGGEIQEYVRTVDHQGLRNVVAEVAGAVMGLLHCPQGSEVVVVSDYLGVMTWPAGLHWMSSPVVIRWVLALLGAIERRQLRVAFCHHPGHQKDASDFTAWNARADALCTQERQEVEVTAPVSDKIATWLESYAEGTDQGSYLQEIARRVRSLEWRR